MGAADTESDDLLVKPTSDIFAAVLWSAPKNEPILRDCALSSIIDFSITLPYTLIDDSIMAQKKKSNAVLLRAH